MATIVANSHDSIDWMKNGQNENRAMARGYELKTSNKGRGQ